MTPSQTSAPPARPAPERGAGLGGGPRRTGRAQFWSRAVAATLRESPTLPLALLAVAVFVWFAGSEGGFYPTTWYPGALLLLALLLVALVALPAPRPPRAVWAAVLLLGGYALWSYASIAWAEQQGVAWDGANRTVLYAIVFALFALWPMRAAAAAAVVGVLALAIVVVAAVELLRANAAAEPLAYFTEGARFEEPVGYVNANVALWSAWLWPCIVMASRRELAAPLRGAFLGGAAILSGLSLMGQSRGWLIALPLAVIALVALAAARGRIVVALAAVAVGTFAFLGPALDVYDTFEEGRDLGPQLADATRAIFSVAAVLFVVGTLAALLDRRVRLAPRPARVVSGAVVAAFLLAGATAVGAFAVIERNPVSAVADAWDDFKQGGSTTRSAGSRLTGNVATYRYDYWRVAWDRFQERPLTGIGADNFQRDYLQRGESGQQPRFPHSVVLRTLSQTGLVGAALLAAAIALALAVVLRARWRRSDLTTAVAAAGTMAFAYWLLHGSVDWLWEFPGLAAPAFAMLGLAVGLSHRSGAAPRPPRRVRPLVRRLALAAGALSALVLVLGLALPWLAERGVQRAADVWRVDPRAAFDRLDRAESLNPLSTRPDLAAGTIATRLGRLGLAKARFEEVLERDPRDASALLQLGAIASEQGRRPEAIALLERSSRLTPRDELVSGALSRVRAGKRLHVAALGRQLRAASVERVSD